VKKERSAREEKDGGTEERKRRVRVKLDGKR
jgi:hypothetical protein